MVLSAEDDASCWIQVVNQEKKPGAAVLFSELSCSVRINWSEASKTAAFHLIYIFFTGNRQKKRNVETGIHCFSSMFQMMWGGRSCAHVKVLTAHIHGGWQIIPSGVQSYKTKRWPNKGTSVYRGHWTGWLRWSECRVENQEAVSLNGSAAERCAFVFWQILQTRTRMLHRHLNGMCTQAPCRIPV